MSGTDKTTSTPNADRVAILLKALGSDVAESFLAAMPGDQGKRVRDMITALDRTPPLVDEVDGVLEEFDRCLRFAERSSHSGIRLAPGTSAADGNESAEPAKQESHEPIALTEDAFDDLARLKPFQIAGALRNERPRTIALVLTTLEPEQASAALALLPEEVKGDTFLQLRQSPTAPQDMLERIVRTTVAKGRLLEIGDVADEQEETDRRLASMLREMDRKSRAAMLESLVAEDEETAGRVKDLLYVFEDLLRVEGRSMQKLLGEIDSSTLARALHEADTKIVDQVMNNLSKRARESLAEEIELLSSLDPDEQAQARKTVCEVLAQLDEAGQLMMTT